ncbi:hypothetical protein NDU88_008157 [Pleurodeles waltl]|uniref:Uncharacterized protein n=1 Tax=Pleurodeles waltl TaxID=8319 RepID=A0AAV7PNC2_PLEWA|nr:hypothetical protein NDU88_008157 [Pleurodeles waltl]
MNCQVQDTISHVQEGSELHDRVRETLSNREKKNAKVSRKWRAKERDIRVGDFVLVRNRRSGSKFLLPFEKDQWVVIAKKGTMITERRKHETVTRNISFFKVFRLNSGGMDSEPSSPSAIEYEYGDEGGVVCGSSQSTLHSPEMLGDDSLLTDQRSANVASVELPHDADQGTPETIRPRQGVEHYNLHPHPPRSTKLQGFVAD